MSTRIIEVIRDLAIASQSHVIKRNMVDEEPLKVLSKILPVVHMKEAVEHIPVGAFGNMSQTRITGIPSHEPTWLGTLKEYIHGEGWTDEVIDYFKSEIKDQPFPAAGARGVLQVHSYNGICFASNGSHRLVGLVCYLAAKYGDSAIAKSVNHRGTVFDSDALALLQRLYGHSTTGIKLMSRMELEGNVEVGVSNLINIDERYYTYKDGRFVLLWPQPATRLQKLLKKDEIRKHQAKFEKQKYTILNHEDFKRLIETTWLTQALAIHNRTKRKNYV